jgi:uncharacterized membrane protein YesL
MIFALSRIWDRLGTVLWAGLLGSFLSLSVILLPPALAAGAGAATHAMRSQDFGPRDFFATGRRYFFRAWALFLPLAVILAILLFNLRFYALQSGLLWSLPFSLTLGLLFAFALISPFLYPAMVGEGLSLRDTLRVSLATAARRPATATLSTLMIAGLGIVLLITTVGLFLLWPALFFFPASMLRERAGRSAPT